MVSSVPSLLAAVVALKPVTAGRIPVAQGRAVHAWLLHIIGRNDPALSRRLHEAEGPRPFTASNLWGAGPSRAGYVVLSPEQECQLRVTGLTAEVSAAILHALPAPGETLVLSGATFVVQSTATDGAEHPWAGQADYDTLLRQHTATVAPPRGITLRFASPTLFRSGGRDTPLPLPSLVFGGYLRKWNAFSSVVLPEEARQYAEEQVALGRFNLRSRFVSFEAGNKGGHVGFTGEVRFRFLGKDGYWQRVMGLLGVYAFWAGTGYRTTVGLGQTQLAEPPRNAPR